MLIWANIQVCYTGDEYDLFWVIKSLYSNNDTQPWHMLKYDQETYNKSTQYH